MGIGIGSAGCGGALEVPTDAGSALDLGTDAADAGQPPDAQPGDAESPDADPDSKLLRLDWRGERGPPLPTQVVAAERGLQLVAARSDGLVTTASCSPEACLYQWRDQDGRVTQTRGPWRTLHGNPFDPDGRQLLAFETESSAECPVEGGVRTLFQGSLRLVELASGRDLYGWERFRSTPVLESPFTDYGRWLSLISWPEGGCGGVREQVFAAQAPYGAAPIDPNAFALQRELLDGRLAGYGPGDALGLQDPRDPHSFETLVGGGIDLALQGGWLHAFGHWPLQGVGSLGPNGPKTLWAVPNEEWYPEATSLGWVMVCSRVDADGLGRPCLIHDAKQQVPDQRIRLARGPGRLYALLGAAELLVYQGVNIEGGLATYVLDLRSGAESWLHDGPATYSSLGNGDSALVAEADRLWWIDRTRRERLVEAHLVRVVTVDQGPAGVRALPQDQLAVVIVGPTVGAHQLWALDAKSGRFAHLTDRLAYNPPPGAPFFDEGCGVPWVARPAGPPSQTVRSASAHLWFVEYAVEGGPATVWLMPSDLSAPPRALTTLIPVYCRAPLVSPDGKRVVIAPDLYDGRVQLETAEL